MISRNAFLTALVLTAGIFSANSAQAQWSNDRIDAVAAALDDEPSFSKGGHKGKVGSWFINTVKIDWPISDKDVRASWNLDPNRDTDGDGTPDVDDEDIDGDGVPNHKDDDIDGDGVENKDDNFPYEDDKSFCGPMGPLGDLDGDGIPDIDDMFPEDPERSFSSSQVSDQMADKMTEEFMMSMFGSK